MSPSRIRQPVSAARQGGAPNAIYRVGDPIERVVVSRRRIALRVARLASQIARRYEGSELVILAVLTGSLIFLADLIRALPLRMRLDVISISSYPGRRTSCRAVKLCSAVPDGLKGRNVLIVDDILDSGKTIGKLSRAVHARGPADLAVCVLLRKDRPDRPGRPEADFVGFDVGPEFLVGYGLDFDGCYRNLPDICVLRRHCGRAGSSPRASGDRP